MYFVDIALYVCRLLLYNNFKEGGNVTRLRLVRVPCIVLVPLFELAVMFCTGDNKDILIVRLLLEGIVFKYDFVGRLI